ncbi:hypothetical protein DM860_016649 [Cuscuta australis]|uniref:Polymerase nucleotidyl transferase domain-containing protein n=1 Tax=Cuscuta australis TaxID=267555 RepID=A0A328DL46_9ASTE|nr:hypothetical protein DM860_016649 [Cuscuta australis]
MKDSKQQLIDSLTSHISLYNSRSSNPATCPNPRSSILKWFSSLTVHQRQAHLTVVDAKFTQIIFQMRGKLKSNGNGLFIILPDIPDCLGSSLPSICFRKSHGLLTRVAESNEAERFIRDSIRLFDSKEGEGIDDGSYSADRLDSLTVSEDLVGSVDKFVDAMDAVSDGRFLRGEESCIGSEWAELDWLKARGYYSADAFIANRLEVALRLSWLSCTNCKKRGAKLKDKVISAGLAANTFWRKKGCVDWWEKLEEATKQKVFLTALGKIAKSLAADIFKGKRGVLDDNTWQYGGIVDQPFRCTTTLPHQECTDESYVSNPRSVSQMPSSLIRVIEGLSILQNISTMLFEFQHAYYERERLYFSSLESISLISDCILRKLRGLLMVISHECTKVELLEDDKSNSSLKKNNERLGSGNNKKTRKNSKVKKKNHVTKLTADGVTLPKSLEVDRFGLAHGEDGHVCSSSSLDFKGHGKGQHTNTVQNVSKKKRERNKRKNSSCKVSAEAGSNQKGPVKFSSLPLSCEDHHMEPALLIENLVEETSKVDVNEDDNSDEQIRSCSGAVQMGSAAELTNGCHSTGRTDGIRTSAPMRFQASESVLENEKAAVALETIVLNTNSSVTSPMSLIETVNNPELRDINRENKNGLNREVMKQVVLGKQEKVGDQEEIIFSFQECGSIDVHNSGPANASTYLSYEWPSVAPIHFQSGNSHIPPATDRLHLDVSHNWQRHYHQSYVRTVHRVRNPSIESGCTGIISRPLAMNLDWPPILHGVNGIATSVTCNYDAGFLSRRPSFQQDLASQSIHCNTASGDDERVYSGDFDFSESKNVQEAYDEHEYYRMPEEELEVHGLPGVDYNQYFGGGVMYWNPSDFPGTSFSRPPSLSSDDSSWAWREADMNRAVDDMVAFSSSYSTNGLTSPSATSFCSPFDPLGSGTRGYVVSGSEVNTSKVSQSSIATSSDLVGEENAPASLSKVSLESETKAGDTLPYPILRPIIIPNMSRERSRSDFRRSHDRTSPCIPPNRQEQPRMKRPPSPVVLCVPRAPRLPPPSPVGDSRRHRIPTVRSGSSSPRHWGMKGWLHDGINFEEACKRMDGSEVVWPPWRSKNFSGHQLTQPLTGALLQDHLIAISQLTRDKEHPDASLPLQPSEMSIGSTEKAPLSLIHSNLHDEINTFYKEVAAENLIRKPCINWAVKRVTRSLQVLWPRSRTNIFGSNATGLSLPSSDVDLVVCLPPVRNLEPIKEAGILEGRNGIKETCLQHAARYLANQEWVKNDSLKIVENTAIPIIMLVVEVPHDLITSSSSHSRTPKAQATGEEVNTLHTDVTGSESCTSPKWPAIDASVKNVKSVRLDISFKSPSHTGLQTTELVKELTEQFPATKPLALVLKQFLADRSLDQSYSGGLSSYSLVLLIIRFLQHEHHHGRSIVQNYGSLLMDFFYFFGNVFDPRQMRVSIHGSGLYISRERGCSIDPIYIDDPLFPTNNVGRNCFRIHQCIKAFADAYCTLENEITFVPTNGDTNAKLRSLKLLPKIIPSIMQLDGFQLSGDYDL